MKTLDLGSLRPKWRGTFDNYITYQINDIMRFKAGVYRCIRESLGVEPTNSSCFEPIALGCDILSNKGELLTFDGQVQIPIPTGNNGEYLKMVEGMPTWALQEGRAGSNCKALCKGSPINSVKTYAFLMDDGSIRSSGEGTHYAN